MKWFVFATMICAILAGIVLAVVREKEVSYPWRRLLKVFFAILIWVMICCGIIGASSIPDVDGWFLPLVFMSVSECGWVFLGYAAVIPRKMHDKIYNDIDDGRERVSYWVAWFVFFAFVVWGIVRGIVYIPLFMTIATVGAVVSYVAVYLAMLFLLFIGAAALSFGQWLTE